MICTKEEFTKKLNDCAADCSLPLEFGEAETEKLYKISARLSEFSEKFNLTAIKDTDGIIKKHITDSLFCAAYLKKIGAQRDSLALCDIGSGAGFPSLPIAAALPSLSVTAIDSTLKKVDYMRSTAEYSGIPNFTSVCMRAEEAGQGKYRERFDFVTARAVAALQVLLELCVPMIKTGGVFVAMKGAAAKEERMAAENAAKVLGCVLIDEVRYTLSGDEDTRFLLVFRKDSPTASKYPRNFSQISKKPL